ncbi:Tudor domain-containing protein 7-like protein, partial [Dinothrombium tinctorium]
MSENRTKSTSCKQAAKLLSELCQSKRWPMPKYSFTKKYSSKNILHLGHCELVNLHTNGYSTEKTLAKRKAAQKMLDLLQKHKMYYSSREKKFLSSICEPMATENQASSTFDRNQKLVSKEQSIQPALHQNQLNSNERGEENIANKSFNVYTKVSETGSITERSNKKKLTAVNSTFVKVNMPSMFYVGKNFAFASNHNTNINATKVERPILRRNEFYNSVETDVTSNQKTLFSQVDASPSKSLKNVNSFIPEDSNNAFSSAKQSINLPLYQTEKEANFDFETLEADASYNNLESDEQSFLFKNQPTGFTLQDNQISTKTDCNISSQVQFRNVSLKNNSTHLNQALTSEAKTLVSPTIKRTDYIPKLKSNFYSNVESVEAAKNERFADEEFNGVSEHSKQTKTSISPHQKENTVFAPSGVKNDLKKFEQSHLEKYAKKTETAQSKSSSDIETIKSALRAVVQTSKVGFRLYDLEKEYEDLNGCPIPYLNFGFENLKDFLCSIPDTVIVKGSGKETIVNYVPNSNTAHIEKLVKNQKTSGKKKPKILPPKLSEKRFNAANLKKQATFRPTTSNLCKSNLPYAGKGVTHIEKVTHINKSIEIKRSFEEKMSSISSLIDCDRSSVPLSEIENEIIESGEIWTNESNLEPEIKQIWPNNSDESAISNAKKEVIDRNEYFGMNQNSDEQVPPSLSNCDQISVSLPVVKKETIENAEDWFAKSQPEVHENYKISLDLTSEKVEKNVSLTENDQSNKLENQFKWQMLHFSIEIAELKNRLLLVEKERKQRIQLETLFYTLGCAYFICK